MTVANILAIAGSDPSGGAGIQADLKTIQANGGYGMAVITALTAQNTKGVSGIHEVPAAFVEQQIMTILKDIRIDAIKIGMLAKADIIRAVAGCLDHLTGVPVVLDPVCVATSGARLIAPDAIDAMKTELLPKADILTPNIPEAGELLNRIAPRDRNDMEQAAKRLLKLGPNAVLLKGGHLKGNICSDVLAGSEGLSWFEDARIATPNTHGTGCTLSSAIATQLPVKTALSEAVGAARDYLRGAIMHGHMLSVGRGHGPVCHGWRQRQSGDTHDAASTEDA
ncbi:bifunctional hydroxymethylpyrimidine kinase/phosphomethylpyrimidine kinase [Hoeflea prorocentri]|uniref:hydroxymethylpyrimidine kinase n=1 Tax=Hoeflea prorocentri TaxID=1922333 RepID=A0A9X3ZJZ0_9HYPH|nr:bifunctional hydroxymethylpyrimidine kinase/phosphomethylpyrimidine kinase [Hoeflea prorocentri]MCY6383506.1 bifunctional hydroxymethylpyrimidine kinase/phosphomethylpyrimidine kinase [Hoeflea prorocentri]MDA5401306.1 bifunctional hydroxymethylpyrimidine kinase/phosphomethylpyrimidine kinase [Hoeflea prorocentri]